MKLRVCAGALGKWWHPASAGAWVSFTIALLGCAPVYPPGVSVKPPINRVMDNGTLVAANVTSPLTPDYKINPGDLISIKFPRLPAYSDTFLVRPDGKISPPFVKSVAAAGRTSDELQEALTERYRALIRSVPPPSQRRYPLQVDDVVSVRFPYFAEMNSDATVRVDGRISLPLVGEIVAEGRTPSDVQGELKRLYTGKVDNPEVVVMVKPARTDVYEYRGTARRMPDAALAELVVNITKTSPPLVYVGGEVPAPGMQPFVSETTALQAIYTAGGPAPSADIRSVIILRRGLDNGVIRVVANLAADVDGAGTSNIVLQPFDVVIVPRSNIAKVGDALDQYVYRIVRPLANSSIGFFFTKQVGTVSQQTDTTTTIR